MAEPSAIGPPELEALLGDLGASLTWPELPDSIAAARNRLAAGERVPAAPRHRWRWVAAGVALLVVAAVPAIPGPRKAVADLFGLGGVEVHQVPTSAPPPPSLPLDLGTPTTLEAAAASVPFRIFVPTAAGTSPAVFEDTIANREVVSLVYPPGGDLPASDITGVGLLVTEFQGSITPFIGKLTGQGGQAVTVDGRIALWIQGPHELFYEVTRGEVANAEPRLAANTLVVSRDGTTIRLEGAFDRDTAVRLAESLEPVV
jgi:hypothetical protein